MNLLVNSNFKIASQSFEEFIHDYFPSANSINKNFDNNNKKILEIVDKLQKNNKNTLNDENKFQMFRTRLLKHIEKFDKFIKQNKTHKMNHKYEKIIGVHFRN